MCRLKSGIALRDRLYIPDQDRHGDMLKELDIKDDYIGASKTFVRWELVPPDGNMLADVDTWVLSVDQDIVPDWWDEEARKPGIVDAVKAWAAEHIMVSGDKKVDHGIYYLFGDAKITLLGNSKATLWDNSQATLCGNSKATLCGNSKATLFGNSQATLWDNSKATLWDNSQATLCGNSKATHDQCIIHNYAILICYKDHTIRTSEDWQVIKV